MRPLRLVLEYFHPWPNSTGWHVAVAEGRLRAAGADVEVSTYDPLRGDGLGALVEGLADLAVVPANRLLARREEGEPVVAIAATNHVALETIQTLASTGIERPRDLAGRRVALNPTPRGLAMVRHLVARDGGDPDRVRFVDSGVRELDVAEVAAGVADATFGGYWAWDALAAHPPPGDEHVVWRIDALGAPAFQPYLLAVREAFIDAEGERLRALLVVAAEAFGDTARDPARGRAVLERVMPYFPADRLARSLELVAPTWFDPDGRWGTVREDLLEAYARWMTEWGVLRSAEAWRGAATGALLP
jgi:putative hydroxymethylpyrimidine transport system substrate-binding protein